MSGAQPGPSSRMCREQGKMSATVWHNSSDSGSSKKNRGISRGWRAERTALAFGCVGETSPHVFGGQLREIGKNLGLGHAARQISQDVANRNTSASNAWFPKSDGRIHSDSVEQVHRGSLRQLIFRLQSSGSRPSAQRSVSYRRSATATIPRGLARVGTG